MLDTLWSPRLPTERWLSAEQICFAPETSTKTSHCRRRKKHIKTVPVKIRREKNNPRKKHAHANFTFTTKQYLKNIAFIFEPDSVLVLSIHDKAKVSIGITVATKQAQW